MMSKKRTTKKSELAKSYLPFVIIGVVLLAAVASGVWLLRTSLKEAGATGTVAGGAPGAQPPHTSGGANARVTLEEFGDYQCPSCGVIYPEVEKIKSDYGDRLRFIFRPFPLTNAHANALVATHAAEAAGLQDKFWQMHDELYRNQKEWAKSGNARTIFESYARSIGLDLARFTRDMDGADVDARTVADHERGESLGVMGTPAFFLNGQPLPTNKPLTGADLRAAIDAALGK